MFCTSMRHCMRCVCSWYVAASVCNSVCDNLCSRYESVCDSEYIIIDMRQCMCQCMRYISGSICYSVYDNVCLCGSV